jgi:geranylgeranyl pyrophosphate synthase
LDALTAARTSNGAESNGAGHPGGGLLTAAVTGGPRPPLDAAQIERATYLVEACGGREWTAVRAKANLDAALGALERVRLSAIPHRDLADIAVFVVERES